MACASVLEKFKEIAECLICHNSVTEARQLPCLHAFCSRCLGNLIEDTETHACALLSCPVCSYSVEELDIESFPLANFFNSFSNTLNKVLFLKDGELCSVCKQKDVETVGSHACLDCGKVLCDSCLFCHSQFLQGHKTYSLGDIEQKHIDELLRKRKKGCAQHNEKDLEYCCNDCIQLLCVSCFMGSHKEHEVETLETSSETYKSELQEVVDSLNKELSKCMKTTDETKEASELLKTAHKNCRENIQRHTRCAKLQLDETEAKLLKDIDKKERKLAEQLERKTENLESIQKQIKQSIHYLTLVQKNGTDTEICETMMADGARLESAADDTNGDRHKVPVPNLHLENCGDLFKIPTFPLVDKVSEFLLPFKPGGIAVDKNGRIAVCEYGGSRASVFDTNGDEYLSLKIPQQAKLVDIACNDDIYIMSDKQGFIRSSYYSGEKNQNILTENVEAVDDFGLDVYDNSLYFISHTRVRATNVTSEKISTKANILLDCLNHPFLVAAEKNQFVVSYREKHKTEAYYDDGEEIFTYGTGTPGSGDKELDTPWGVAVDKQGCTFISDSNNKRVVVLSPRGKLLGYVGYCDGLYESTYPLAVTQDGKLLVGWGNMDGEGPWKVTIFSYTVVGCLD